jgi:hypothetical protein
MINEIIHYIIVSKKQFIPKIKFIQTNYIIYNIANHINDSILNNNIIAVKFFVETYNYKLSNCHLADSLIWSNIKIVKYIYKHVNKIYTFSLHDVIFKDSSVDNIKWIITKTCPPIITLRLLISNNTCFMTFYNTIGLQLTEQKIIIL